MIKFEVITVKNLKTHTWSPFALDKVYQEFSVPITPQQNGVVERKNRVIQKMAKAMLHNKDMARNLWGEAVNTMCHTVNRVYFKPSRKKTP